MFPAVTSRGGHPYTSSSAPLEAIIEEPTNARDQSNGHFNEREAALDSALSDRPAKKQRVAYRCELCSTAYTHKKSLTVHNKTPAHCEKAGLPIPEYQCSVCLEYFSRRDNVQRHVREAHNGLKRHVAREMQDHDQLDLSPDDHPAIRGLSGEEHHSSAAIFCGSRSAADPAQPAQARQCTLKKRARDCDLSTNTETSASENIEDTAAREDQNGAFRAFPSHATDTPHDTFNKATSSPENGKRRPVGASQPCYKPGPYMDNSQASSMPETLPYPLVRSSLTTVTNQPPTLALCTHQAPMTNDLVTPVAQRDGVHNAEDSKVFPEFHDWLAYTSTSSGNFATFGAAGRSDTRLNARESISETTSTHASTFQGSPFIASSEEACSDATPATSIGTTNCDLSSYKPNEVTLPEHSRASLIARGATARPITSRRLECCPLCHRSFEQDRVSVRAHIAEHLADLKAIHMCHECDIGFTHEADLRSHMETVRVHHRCGFDFEHLHECTGHHSKGEFDHLIKDTDRPAMTDQLREWEQFQLKCFHAFVAAIPQFVYESNDNDWWSLHAMKRSSILSVTTMFSELTVQSAPDKAGYQGRVRGSTRSKIRKTSTKLWTSRTVSDSPTIPKRLPSATSIGWTDDPIMLNFVEAAARGDLDSMKSLTQSSLAFDASAYVAWRDSNIDLIGRYWQPAWNSASAVITPFRAAAAYGHLHVVSWLLFDSQEHYILGIDREIKPEPGNLLPSALALAICMGHLEVAALLIETGARVGDIPSSALGYLSMMSMSPAVCDGTRSPEDLCKGLKYLITTLPEFVFGYPGWYAPREEGPMEEFVFGAARRVLAARDVAGRYETKC